jgi:hypothetical protein
MAAVTPELRERDLVKTAGLTAAMVGVLARRGIPDRTATFAAQAALAAFTAAATDWIAAPTADFAELMQQALGDLRRAVDSP